MEREILFRGKTGIEGDDKWYYGFLFSVNNGKRCLRVETKNDTHIIPVVDGTIGQLFYRLDDETPIFEGDILDIEGSKFIVFWDFSKLALTIDQFEGDTPEEEINISKIKIIGNITDNPELCVGAL